MTEQGIGDRLQEISKNRRWIDTLVHRSPGTKKYIVSDAKIDLLREIFSLFRELRWQIPFNNYKELRFSGSKPIDMKGCGTPVKIRPCDPKHQGNTYFGILLGEVALTISHKISDGAVTASHSMYNPAIFVPELKTIIYGCESYSW